jgi:hypothetical protein
VVTAAPQRLHECSIRCGFRDFRIVDGYFHLNGRRIFLRSTHTGNAMPIGQQAAVVGDFGRRDMIYAKASGFNAVRFIAGVAYPEQLDLCDELGLMVYECFASWLLGDSPKMAERFDRSTSAMIRRDRNHPSITIWGLLNETQDGPVFRQAVSFLPKLRRLDPTRLVLLDSGRWDGQWLIGSASNPGSSEWQPVWGVEAPDAGKASLGAGGYASQAGDAHYYPGVPQSPQTDRFIREFGREGKPVFLSEYGKGLGPAELPGFVLESILALGALLVMEHLVHGGLPDVDISGLCGVTVLDFGNHRSPPCSNSPAILFVSNRPAYWLRAWRPLPHRCLSESRSTSPFPTRARGGAAVRN